MLTLFTLKQKILRIQTKNEIKKSFTECEYPSNKNLDMKRLQKEYNFLRTDFSVCF